MTIRDLIRKSILPPEAIGEFDRLRRDAFTITQKVYADRAASYDVGRPPYGVFAYGVVSLASLVYEKSWRLTSLVSPVRVEALRPADIKRILDTCIDEINYLSWLYAMTVIATGAEGHLNSDDAPDYLVSKREEDK